MKTFNTELSKIAVREAWLEFQGGALAVESTATGFVVALPHTLPDGWQMVVELQQGPAGKWKLTDSGKTLGWIAARGQNVETDAVSEHVRRISQETGMQRDGWELFKWLDLPFQAVELHVFAEGLNNVAHLYFLHDPTPRAVDTADRTLRRVFADTKLTASENHALNGKTERSIRVDYFIPLAHPVAFQVLRRRGRILSTMEQWGYRWQDLRKTNPQLKPVMVYDPVVQDVDEAARDIGEEVCDLFCAYDETDKIHELLQSAKE